MNVKQILKMLIEEEDTTETKPIEQQIEEFLREYLRKNLLLNPDELLLKTAKVFADTNSLLAYEFGKDAVLKVRELNWKGVETDSDTFREQARIIEHYNMFSFDKAVKIIEEFGDKMRYKLCREDGAVALYLEPNVLSSSYKEMDKFVEDVRAAYKRSGLRSRLCHHYMSLLWADYFGPAGPFSFNIKIKWS